MVYILILILILGFIPCLIVAGVPKSDEERRIEDEEQMKYLKQYKEKHKKI